MYNTFLILVDYALLLLLEMQSQEQKCVRSYIKMIINFIIIIIIIIRIFKFFLPNVQQRTTKHNKEYVAKNIISIKIRTRNLSTGVNLVNSIYVNYSHE